MTTITDFAALSTRLPMLDRGALSEAWRDVLRATDLRERAGLPAARPRASLAPSRSAHAAPAVARPRAAVVAPAAAARTAARAERASAPLEAASRRARLCAAPPPRAACVPVARSAQATSVYTLADGARVVVRFATHAGQTHVTVLCPERLRAPLARALEHLRGRFDASGVVVAFSAEGRGR